MERDKFYFFVAEFLQKDTPSKVRQMIDKNMYFLVDTANNNVTELSYKDTVDEEKYKRQKNVTLKTAMRETRKKEKILKNKENNLYDKDVDNLINKFNIP